MKNPAAIDKPQLSNPSALGPRGRHPREESKRSRPWNNGKGNQPYLRFRRRMRKDILR